MTLKRDRHGRAIGGHVRTLADLHERDIDDRLKLTVDDIARRAFERRNLHGFTQQGNQTAVMWREVRREVREHIALALGAAAQARTALLNGNTHLFETAYRDAYIHFGNVNALTLHPALVSYRKRVLAPKRKTGSEQEINDAEWKRLHDLEVTDRIRHAKKTGSKANTTLRDVCLTLSKKKGKAARTIEDAVHRANQKHRGTKKKVKQTVT